MKIIYTGETIENLKDTDISPGWSKNIWKLRNNNHLILGILLLVTDVSSIWGKSSSVVTKSLFVLEIDRLT